MQILYDSILLSTKPKAALHYLDFVGSSWETLIQKNILQNILHTRIYANLKLMDNTKKMPIKVDVADCYPVGPLYPGHHNNR